MSARPAWWPTKAQKERADRAHLEAMKTRRAELERATREREGRTTDALVEPCASCGNPAYVVADNQPLCDSCLKAREG